jgi:hypothetical protein
VHEQCHGTVALQVGMFGIVGSERSKYGDVGT